MNLDDLMKNLIWIALFIIALAGIFALFKKLGVL